MVYRRLHPAFLRNISAYFSVSDFACVFCICHVLALCRYCACVASLRHLYLHAFSVFAVLLSLLATIGSMYNIQVLHIANQKRAPLLTCFPNKTEKNNTTMSTFSVLKFFWASFISYEASKNSPHPTPFFGFVLHNPH